MIASRVQSGWHAFLYEFFAVPLAEPFYLFARTLVLLERVHCGLLGFPEYRDVVRDRFDRKVVLVLTHREFLAQSHGNSLVDD